MKALRIVCNVMLGIIITALATLAAVLIIPILTGHKSMAVLSGSMAPEIPVGAVCFAKDIDFNKLKIGDIITYRLSGDTMVTHRIIMIDSVEKQVTTKGDANDTEDASPVTFDNIIGRVNFHIPYLGYISIYAKTPLGITAVCVLLFVLILLLYLPDIFSMQEENCMKIKIQSDKKMKKIKSV